MNLFRVVSTLIAFSSLGSAFRNHVSIDDFLNSEIKLFPNHTVQLIQNLEDDALERFKSILDNDDVLTNAYDNFKRRYGEKNAFATSVENAISRKQLFKDNLVYIFQHNLYTRTRLHSQFEMGINKFVDMHLEEFKRERLGLDIPMHEENHEHDPFFSHQNHSNTHHRNLPSAFDWREEGIITPVKDQMKCGACVMFSMTSALEGHHTLCSRKNDVDLSEQFMVDCAIRANGYKQNKGCDGNTFPDSLKFAMDHGITSEFLYPYTGEQGKCKFEGMHPVTKVKEVNRLADNSKDVKLSVMASGPVSIGIWVFKQFMFYKTGIYDSCGHPSTAVGGHAMAITGFKDEGRTHYYVIKNQWGEDWGENGYVRYISTDARCGLEKLAYTYTVEC